MFFVHLVDETYSEKRLKTTNLKWCKQWISAINMDNMDDASHAQCCPQDETGQIIGYILRSYVREPAVQFNHQQPCCLFGALVCCVILRFVFDLKIRFLSLFLGVDITGYKNMSNMFSINSDVKISGVKFMCLNVFPFPGSHSETRHAHSQEGGEATTNKNHQWPHRIATDHQPTAN